MITVAIVEDNITIREGIKEFINDTNEFRCIAEFSTCEELLADFTELKPNIILMDIDLPGISGIEGIKEINKIESGAKIIILTIHAESENIFEALAAGAHGYLEKKTPPSQIEKILREVYNKKSNMNTFIARKVMSYFSNDKEKKDLDSSEYNILKYLISGKSPKAIADSVEVPTEMIYSNFYNIYEKLHRKYNFGKASVA